MEQCMGDTHPNNRSSGSDDVREESDIDGIVDCHREALKLHDPSHPTNSNSLKSLADALYLKFQKRNELQDLDEAIEIYTNLLQLDASSNPDQCIGLNNLGTAIQNRFESQGDPQDIKQAVQLFKQALALHHPPHPNHGVSLNYLCDAVKTWIDEEEPENLADVDKAIGFCQEMIADADKSHDAYGTSLNHIAGALCVRFQLRGNFEDILKAIQFSREELEVHGPLHPLHGRALNNLATTLQISFGQQGNIKDLTDAIELYRKTSELYAPGHKHRPTVLSNLSNAIRIRFVHRGDPQDLDEAIDLGREALALCPAPHPDRSWSLNSLGNVIGIRFEERGDPRDMNEAITLHKEALDLASPEDPDLPVFLTNLGTSIQTRFEQQGNLEDINEAVQWQTEALARRPHPNSARSLSLNNLANALRFRFEQLGDHTDIDEAITLHREALELRPPPHPDRGMSLNSLAVALRARFEHQGHSEDIDEAIELHRKELALDTSFNGDHSMVLTNLSAALLVRFEKQGDLEDIEEAIDVGQKALALRAPPHPERGLSLNHLANAMQTRMEKTGDYKGGHEAIQFYREALSLHAPPHPQRVMSLYNLAAALKFRFSIEKDSNDINEAVGLNRESLRLHAPPHPDYSSSLNNLSEAILLRFGLQKNTKDLTEAIELCHESLVQRPSPHPFRGESLINVSLSLTSAYEHTGDKTHLDNAISTLQEASTYFMSPPRTRFDYAQIWVGIAARHNHDSLLMAYQSAIDLLPQLAAVHVDLASRYQILTATQNTRLAFGAATCAINEGQYDTAVQLLEASRSIFWSQALKLQTPLRELYAVNADLALKFQKLSREMEQAAFRDGSKKMLTDVEVIFTEAKAVHYRKLNEEWEKILASIRVIPGFDGFLKPKSIAALQEAAVSGPIIILTATGSTCTALIIQVSHEVQCLKLSDMVIGEVNYWADLSWAISRPVFDMDVFLASRRSQSTQHLSEMHTRLFGERENQINRTSDTIFKSMLADLWKKIVKPVFDVLKFKKSSNPPRLWWCPTGPFIFLPVHAAGIYEASSTNCVSDYVVSSYTPTVTSLLDPPTQNPTSFKMTAIIQSDVPNFSRDYSALPGSRVELEKIASWVPSQWLTTLGDTTHATVEAALHHIRESLIVHFASHGKQDKDPLNSALILCDGPLKVSYIMRRPETDADTPEDVKKSMSLAFLSACETAKGDESTPDEAMHLAASLMFAGFHGVVATMWTMDDGDGPKIADAFYKHLFEKCDPNSNPPVVPDLTKAAEALHGAVVKLRQEPGISFKRWVPFVHYGL